METKIKNFKLFSDERGDLIPINFSELPFIPKRIFTVNNVSVNTFRGNHSHFNTKQFLICISGKIEIKLHDGKYEKTIFLNKSESVFVDNLIWDSQKFMTEDSTLLVICSTEYNSEDYIFDFEEFIKLKKK